MKVAVFKQYGSPDVVTIEERPKLEAKDNEVLIKVKATTVDSGDSRIRSLNVPTGFGLLVRLFFGITKPRKQVLGTALAGEIMGKGAKVSKWEIGDQVIADMGMKMGAHSEYVTLPEDAAIAIQPANLSFWEAAAIPFGGTTALHFLTQMGHVQTGDQVLINGATGTVGSAAIQLAKDIGAEVTAVCSGDNAELAKKLGADHVIDYAQQDFTQKGETWDVIMDNVGNAPWSQVKDSLTPKGRLLMVVASFGETLAAPFVSKKGGKRAIAGTANGTAEDLEYLAKLAKLGVFKPLIDSRYPLGQIREAHRRVDSGHKRGSVVVTMA